jgi:hypothetical protein
MGLQSKRDVRTLALEGFSEAGIATKQGLSSCTILVDSYDALT